MCRAKLVGKKPENTKKVKKKCPSSVRSLLPFASLRLSRPPLQLARSFILASARDQRTHTHTHTHTHAKAKAKESKNVVRRPGRRDGDDG